MKDRKKNQSTAYKQGLDDAYEICIRQVVYVGDEGAAALTKACNAIWDRMQECDPVPHHGLGRGGL